jgi:hypothetical protein
LLAYYRACPEISHFQAARLGLFIGTSRQAGILLTAVRIHPIVPVSGLPGLILGGVRARFSGTLPGAGPDPLFGGQ